MTEKTLEGSEKPEADQGRNPVGHQHGPENPERRKSIETAAMPSEPRLLKIATSAADISSVVQLPQAEPTTPPAPAEGPPHPAAEQAEEEVAMSSEPENGVDRG